ncbi:acyl transferase/acyl hydrolase/lysophospholipase [Hygrophoropsis aurantiaca]|uniref:Acyl transferase/acyl hydrolase/lysophospholipase n=1 Tax=Hygrophoropsis aurantiaca TaxID=72124 RepID=A0ACB8A545_9AGAM|nr:acyl transferase/acyl hydrolase/lysophospholipase [Hygrophoropsis aurantiaca]
MSDSESEDDIDSRIVLSIDGGGFRGLACLLILAHLTEEIAGGSDEDPPKPCQIFDLICGTSTGGLIAILLGRFGLSCKDAIDVYKEIGATMFGGEADSGKIWGHIIHGEEFSSALFEKKLEEITTRYTGSKDTLFKPRKDAPDTVHHESTLTFVPVVSKIASAGVDPNRIRSYPRPSDDIDPAPYGHKWTIVQGARGTCAAPLYFSPLKIQSGKATYVFQDAGASGFNNPAIPAMDEAEKLFGYDANITLVTLGTGLRSLVKEGQYRTGGKKEVEEEDVANFMQQILDSVKNVGKNARNAPQLAKRIAKQLLEVATDTEISHLHTAEEFDRQGRRQYYHRFNPPQGLGDIALTDCRQEDKIAVITGAWLKSVNGRNHISKAVNNLKGPYERKERKAREQFQKA